MMLTIGAADFAKLSLATQAELISLWSASQELAELKQSEPAREDREEFTEFDMSEVADLTFKQTQTWMEVASDRTKLGLRVMAEHGPIVDAKLLNEVGIDNVPHFQSRTTIRTRTVTGDKRARLLGWDEDWEWDKNGRIVSGRYAITPITHHSLRRFFRMG